MRLVRPPGAHTLMMNNGSKGVSKNIIFFCFDEIISLHICIWYILKHFQHVICTSVPFVFRTVSFSHIIAYVTGGLRWGM